MPASGTADRHIPLACAGTTGMQQHAGEALQTPLPCCMKDMCDCYLFCLQGARHLAERSTSVDEMPGALAHQG